MNAWFVDMELGIGIHAVASPRLFVFIINRQPVWSAGQLKSIPKPSALMLKFKGTTTIDTGQVVTSEEFVPSPPLFTAETT
jgi:hypothetical protein